ncbi:MAG: hypothetical protein SGJ27_14830 [Candidatus Melainabacteria bacterium]|nr:hypothetical protein [Candidatus Melainabacteria bacterium]
MLYQLPLKPLRLGDLVSIAFRMFRCQWRYMTARLFWPSLLASLATSGLAIGLAHTLQSLKAENFQAIYQDCGWLMLALILLLISQWLVAIRATALYRIVFDIDTNFQEAMKYATRRKWAVFSIFTFGSFIPIFIGFFITVLFFLCFAIRAFGGLMGLLAFPVAFVGGLFIVVATAIALLITILLFGAISTENIKLDAIFKRAFELGFNYPMRGGSFVCLLTASVFLLMIATSCFLLPFEIYESYLVTQNPNLDLPFYLRVLETVSQTINNIVSMSIAITAAGLYYRDIRFRFDGTDILERLQKLVPEAASPQ